MNGNQKILEIEPGQALEKGKVQRLPGSTRYYAAAGLSITFLMLILSGLLLVVSLATAGPSSLRITVGTFFPYYSPAFVHIEQGTSVSWENPTADLHSITHDGCKRSERCAFDSGPLGPNGTFTVRHLPPGSYPYHCSFHPIMQGNLVVKESDFPNET